MLLVVTPNPALDRTMVIPNLRLGHRHRAEQVIVAAGGKGLNVARAARTLGPSPRVCAPLGGITGQFVAHLAGAEGLEGYWSWHSAGETRTCVLVVDPQGEGQDATPLDEHGPPLSSEDWLAFVDVTLRAAAVASLATICGSLPPGVPPLAAGDLVRALTRVGCQVVVDTSGPSLAEAIAAQPYGVKVNHAELSKALAMPIESMPQAIAALAAVRARGVALAVVSLGEQGALAANETGTCRATPPPLKVVSTVGSGDSLMAGLVVGLLRGYALDEALRLGVACGAADALTIGGGLIDHPDLPRILAETTVEWV
ncbi:MAG: hexose kinase [Chloroflexaceae bacterium]|nr:hexose kinase [Chloroflexaceae bacterium]